MKSIQDDIKQFMVAAEQDCPDKPAQSTEAVRLLRAKLIMEEATEQCKALGIEIYFNDEGLIKTIYSNDSLVFENVSEADLTEVADGIADQIYVSVGTAIALGIDMVPIWGLVQCANMAKFGPGSYKNEHGKQMKPPGWVSPNAAIEDEIKRQQA